MRTLIALTLLALSGAAQSDVTPFLGKWNMTGTGTNTDVVYWLEVKQEGGVLKGNFLNRASARIASAAPVTAMIGTGSVSGSSRRRRQSSAPLMSGRR